MLLSKGLTPSIASAKVHLFSDTTKYFSKIFLSFFWFYCNCLNYSEIIFDFLLNDSIFYSKNLSVTLKTSFILRFAYFLLSLFL